MLIHAVRAAMILGPAVPNWSRVPSRNCESTHSLTVHSALIILVRITCQASHEIDDTYVAPLLVVKPSAALRVSLMSSSGTTLAWPLASLLLIFS